MTVVEKLLYSILILPGECPVRAWCLQYFGSKAGLAVQLFDATLGKGIWYQILEQDWLTTHVKC